MLFQRSCIEFHSFVTMRKYFIVICIYLSLMSAFGQHIRPDDGILYGDSLVARIDILIDDSDITTLLTPGNENLNIEYPADFIYTYGSEVKDTVLNVGFRLRGNTSRTSDKKSFKVSFNSFEPGKQYRGVEKLNLNGEHNDPSICRAKLGWDMMAYLEVPASRVNHVTLYINNEYKGIYLNIEHIDEEFIQKRFSSNYGDLFKCLYPADMVYKGDDPNLYKEEFWGRRAYALKTNTEEDDYSRLADLINVLNNTPLQEIPCELEKILDIQNYLKFIAADIYMGNWDGHIINMNNFYLYYDTCEERFTMIPYDLDNILGIDWFGEDWSAQYIDQWENWIWDQRPLYQTVMSIPYFKAQVEFHLETLRSHYSQPDFQTYLFALRDTLKPYRSTDIYASLDYGFTEEDFHNNFIHGVGQHAEKGILEFIQAKNAIILERQNLSNHLPVEITELHETWQEGFVSWDIVTAFTTSESNVVFNYSTDSINWNSIQLEPSSLNNYAFSLETETLESNTIWYHISTYDGFVTSSRYPDCYDLMTLANYLPTPQLSINEIVAKNTTGIQDSAQEYEDWVEIYNYGDEPVELGELYLSDRLNQPMHWKLPQVVLEPDEYIVFIADKDQEQGDRHTNFKLNANGETVYLFDNKANYNALIDSLAFPAIESDVSFGRLPNGLGEPQVLPYQTYGRNNEEVAKTTSTNTSETSVIPNPTRGGMTVFNAEFDYGFVTDMNGKLCFEFKTTDFQTTLSLDHLDTGIYLLTLVKEDQVHQTHKIVKQ